MTVRASSLGSSAVATVSKFAAAFGFAPKASGDKEDKEETDDEKNKGKKAKPARLDGESDEDYNKRCEEDEKKEKAEGGKDDKEKAETDDDKKEAAARNRAAGATAERERWTAVLSSPEATGKGLAACELLSNPSMASMSAEQLTGILATMPATKAGGVYARMQERDETERAAASPGATTDGSGKGGATKAQMMVAAADKLRGGGEKK